MKIAMNWALAALAVAALGCPTSNPRESSLEPSSPVGVPGPPSAGLGEKRYAGTYVYGGTDAERAAIKTAVDSATDGMIGKNIARGELMKRSEIRPTYTISFDEKGNVGVGTPGYPPEVSPINGTEVQLKNKYGDVLPNRQQFVEGALLQQSRTSDGSGSTQFKLQPDGNTLLVTRISRSPKLPRSVEFKLTYLRQHGTP